MKVILLQDVARIGRRFEVKDVPDGHALNFLIPRNMAELATPENLKRVQARAAKQETDHANREEAFDAALAKLSETQVTLSAEANDQGHLFKGIKPADIVSALEAHSVTLTEDQIELPRPIKEVGTHTIVVHLGEKKGSFELVVQS